MNLTQLIQEQKELIRKIVWDSDAEPHTEDRVATQYTSSLTAIIRSEIERKKGMIRKTQDRDDIDIKNIGYNIAIIEDIAYLENVLKELENN